MWGDRGCGDGSTPIRYDLAVSPGFHGCLPQAFPTIIFLPHIPSVHLFTVNSSPHPGVSPQSLHSSSQSLCLLGDLHPCLGYVCCGKDCLTLIPFMLPQISCFTLSLKCFSSDSDSCPDLEIRPLLQFPHLPRAGPVLLILLFSP